MKNFYPTQYNLDKNYVVNHNYLSEQFEDVDEILQKIKEVVKNNDFTLGSCVDEVEKLISIEANTKNAIAVGSGTDALMLSLKALGIKEGDEVITSTYTFYATIGAIVTSGATPVFCDCGEDYNIDPDKIKDLITEKTRAIMPVHWSGRPCDIDKINDVIKDKKIFIVEDACHALQAEISSKRCGGLGDLGCFSFHPLKNLNVWGDGGIITTNNDELTERLKLIRNHGLKNRDTCLEFAYNSRLDTIQAVVAKHLLEKKLNHITSKRIENALYYDHVFQDIDEIQTVKRSSNLKEVFHLYQFKTDSRRELAEFLKNNGIDAKVHYPTPMHMQPAASQLGYVKGDFPVAEKLASTTISLPVHEFINKYQIENIAKLIKNFFS